MKITSNVHEEMTHFPKQAVSNILYCYLTKIFSGTRSICVICQHRHLIRFA